MSARWKEAIPTWIGVNATAFVLSYTVSPLTAGWPWFAGFLLFNTAMVGALTWLVMPALAWAARFGKEKETPTPR